MRVCLITPPSSFLLDERVFVSLGILKVGAALKQTGFKVDHLDLCGVANYEDVVRDYMASDSEAASVFGITATTPQVPAAVRIARVLRGNRTILGGPHVTLLNAAAKAGNERAEAGMVELLDEFSCLVAGDGERAITRAFQTGMKIVDADDPKSELWQTSQDFTASPWPDRSLVDMSTYHYYIDGVRAGSLVSQLGCPFECGFCGGRNSPMLRRIRTRPSASVIAELRHVHEVYGLSAMMFLDDELNVNKQVVGLMREIKQMGIDWRFRGFVKAELFTSEQAEAMYAAGFRWLLCGFESAHPRILRNINKKAKLEDNTRMLRTAHAAGLKVKALMSFGHPGESEETILATRDWLLEEKPDDFDCTVITVYPGTPYFDKAVWHEPGVYKYEFAGDALYSEDINFTRDVAYYKGIPGEYKAYVWSDFLSRGKLARLRDEVEDEVRRKLSIPYPVAAAAVNYEHSMGMTNPAIIRRSDG